MKGMTPIELIHLAYKSDVLVTDVQIAAYVNMIWHTMMMSGCVGVCSDVCCVTGVLKIVRLGIMKYVVSLCRGCDRCNVFCLNCEAWSCRCSCMGSMSVSSCRCCMFVSCGSSQ